MTHETAMKDRGGNRPPAVFSPDRRYRYLLTRRTGFGESAVCFVMLNPSMADGEKNDATIRRCIGFANSWGYGWFYVVNLSPFRATDPDRLRDEGPEPEDVWERNLGYVMAAARECGLVVVAWGNHGGLQDRAAKVLAALREAGHAVHCLGLTKQGHPKHPLRLNGDTQPILYQE